MTATTVSLYDQYQQRRATLLDLAERQEAVVSQLDLDATQQEGTKHGEVVRGLIERLQTDKLRVLVVGRFSSGKSTFINAMLGQAILPASPTPTTGVLCEVTYADEGAKRAILYPKKGLGPDGNDDPMEVPLTNLREELGKYVKIDHMGETTETNRYRKLELHWPFRLCANGVDLIDTVGLDDPDARDDITLTQTNSADAILFCMKSQDAYSAKDKAVLGLLKSLGYESIFFIITYFDHIKESAAMGEGSEAEFRDYQYKMLSPWTELGQQGIKFVDSKAALLGRINDNPAQIDNSGIAGVELSLERFLVEQKGKAKIVTSLRGLRTVNRAVRRVIPARIAMLETSLEELEQRYRNAELPLKNLEAKRQLMVQRVDTEITDIGREAFDMANACFVNVHQKVKGWAKEYEIEGSVGFPPRKSTLEPVVKEVMEHLRGKLQEDVAEWNRVSLSPMIEQKMARLQDSLESDAREFLKSIDELRVQISVGDDLGGDTIAQENEPSMLGRLFAGGYTVLTGDFITGGLGMVMGFRAMLNTIVIKVVAIISLYALGFLTPVTLVMAVIAAILAGNFLNLFSLKDTIKAKVAEKMGEELNNRRTELARSVEDEVKTQLGKLRDALDAGLAGQIGSVKGEVEAMLTKKKHGQANTEQEIRNLQRLQSENTALEEALDELLDEVGLNLKGS